MKIGVIIQARTSSKRLPGKVLMPLPFGSGISVLQQVVRRLKRSKKINEIIIATTVNRGDTSIVNLARKEGVLFFRGSKQNVLERYYLCAKKNKLDVIVRITSDSPCIEGKLVDDAVAKHLSTGADYSSNTLKNGFPRGLDVEVINFSALEKAFYNAKNLFEREHVTAYIYRTKPSLFKITKIEAPRKLRALGIRITLDTKQDYALLCAIFEYLYPRNQYFNVSDIVKLFKNKPWLKLINGSVQQKNVHITLRSELKEALNILKSRGLERTRDFLNENLIKDQRC